MQGRLKRATARFALVGVVVAFAAIAPSAQASAIVCTTADFDGDTNGDLAVASSREDTGGGVDAGGVNVFLGTGTTLGTTDDIFVAGTDEGDGSTGVAANNDTLMDPSETNDFLGNAVAAGDFDADGFCDLAIGVYGENLAGQTDVGTVEVVYGSATGLELSSNAQLAQSTSGVGDADRESGDKFGYALAVGDFDNDGADDLAVGIPGENVGGTSDAGAVQVLFGDTLNGLTLTGSQYIDANTGVDATEVPNGPENGAQFGSVLAAGDFDGDNDDDLAIGTPLENYSRTNADDTTTGVTDAGAVTVLYSDAGTIDGTDAHFIVQGTLASTDTRVMNIAETAEGSDRMGNALAAGDVDADGDDDLAIGVALENRGVSDAQYDAGVVHVLTGSGTGLTEAAFWEQSDTPDAGSDTNEADDKFGAALAIANFDTTDAGAELAVGASEENATATDSGAVELIENPADDATPSAATFWTQGTSGDAMADTSESADFFGATLAVANINGGAADLVVGVIGERKTGDSTVKSAGMIHILPGSADEFDDTADSVWTQDTAGVKDGGSATDYWGWSIDG